jgi:DNA repair protein RecO
MAYETYTTPVLVCGSTPINSADKSYFLFTRDAGMIKANAKSVRRENSRQRYALQDFTYGKVSLVRGKQGWLIGSIEAIKNYYSLSQSREARRSVIDVFRLIRRLVQGEEADVEVFYLVKTALTLLSQDVNNRSGLEILVQYRILAYLGYLNSDSFSGSLTDLDLQEAVESMNRESEKNLIDLCAEAMKNSQL